MLSSIEILILAIIQGISEYLPVSSAAHLVLVSKYYVFTNQSLLIDICLHLGSLIAIIFYFRNDILNFIKNKNFLIKIFIGTIVYTTDKHQNKLVKETRPTKTRAMEAITACKVIFNCLLRGTTKSR